MKNFIKENEEEGTIYSAEIQRILSALGGSILVALVPIFIYSIIQLIRLGNTGDYLFLLIGSFLSFGATIGCIITILVYGIKKRKSYLAMFLTFCGFIPYLFGCYFVFIRGFWSLRTLPSSFSLWVIIEALISIILGYIVVKKFYEITQISSVVSKDWEQIAKDTFK